jgi:MFS family permease
VALAGLAIGQGLLNPTLTGLLSRNSKADEQGGVLGMNQSLAASARAIGPIVAGALFDRAISLPYYLGGGLTALVVLIVLSLKSSHETSEITVQAQTPEVVKTQNA